MLAFDYRACLRARPAAPPKPVVPPPPPKPKTPPPQVAAAAFDPLRKTPPKPPPRPKTPPRPPAMPARTTPPRPPAPAPFGHFSPPKTQQPPDLLADPFAGGDLLAPAAPAPAPAPPLLDPIFSGMTDTAPTVHDPFAPPPPKKGADLLGDLLAPTETKADPFADPFASPPTKSEGGTFKIDVMAAAFGSCVCGRPKGDHIGAELKCPPVQEDPFSGL